MKKIFTILAVLIFAASGITYSQCTPNGAYTDPGIYPTPVTGLPDGTENVAYAEVLTVNVPADTTLDLSSLIGFPTPPVTVTVNHQTIDNVTGLPTGMSYACNPQTCQINSGSSGCIDISGTPTTTGQHVFNVETTLSVVVPQAVPIIGGTTQNIPMPVAYNLMINASTDVDPIVGNAFAVAQNNPNPVSGFTRIDFFSPTVADVELEVISVSGKVVYASVMKNVSGESSFRLDMSQMARGIYLYTVSNGDVKFTKKMFVE